MIKNKFYEAPEAELLVVKFEENFCGTGDTNVVYGNKGAAGADLGDEEFGPF